MDTKNFSNVWPNVCLHSPLSSKAEKAVYYVLAQRYLMEIQCEPRPQFLIF